MQKTFITINAFSKVEQRRFSQYLQSPLFNQRADVVRLYDCLLEKRADPEDKERFFVSVLPGQPYSAQHMRLLMSYLQKLADQFLALEQWQNTAGAVESSLAQAYRERGLDRHFQDALKHAKQTLERQPLRNSDYFARQGALLWEEARYNSVRHPEDEQSLIQLSDNSDLIWLAQKLRYLCLHTAYRARYNTSQSLSLRSEVDQILENFAFEDVPAISTWYYCLKMLEALETTGYFGKFKIALLQQDQVFNADEVRDLFLFAINYCIRKVNEGQTDYFHDILDFYKDGLLKGHLFDKNVLSSYTYYNIVAAGLHTREYTWVEDFIHRYRNTLERHYRDTAFNFNLARLEFARKNYDAALTCLQHTNYHEPLLNMAAKTIALKIYYIQNEYDVLHAHLEALIKYIRRKPGLGYHRNNYLNLARYTQKLITLNWNDKSEVQTFKLKIESEKVLTEREWLLEQVKGR